jgi:hypothetical protein
MAETNTEQAGAKKLMESAVVDGVEDQGAEEAFMGCMPRETRFSFVLEAVSHRSRLSLFQRAFHLAPMPSFSPLSCAS